MSSIFFFFNDTATTEIYTLSLHDALPIFYDTFGMGQGNGEAVKKLVDSPQVRGVAVYTWNFQPWLTRDTLNQGRSEEHTSELQSRQYLVCRLLLEKKNYIPSLQVHLALPR